MTDPHGHAAHDTANHHPGTTPNPVPPDRVPPLFAILDELWQAQRTGKIFTVSTAVHRALEAARAYGVPMTSRDAASWMTADQAPSIRYGQDAATRTGWPLDAGQ